MTVLAELDAVRWDELHHAYGPATDVPDLLRGLLLPEATSQALRDAAIRNKRSIFDQVTWELWGNVFHQGSVWQVTATVVPFLVAILRDDSTRTECKLFLITYLHHLALGYPEDLFPNLLNPDEQFAAVIGMSDPGGEPDYGADDHRPLIWMRDSYEAVERHIEDVLPFLDAINDELAEAAIAFCGSFPRRTNVTLPGLRKLASKSDTRGANAAISMAVLGATDAQPLAEKIAASPDRLTALLGACATALADTGGVSAQVVATLTTPLGQFGKMKSAHASTVSGLVGCSLARLGPDFRERSIKALCAQLVSATAVQSLTLTHNLLTLAFETPIRARPQTLTAHQRVALEAIRDHGAFTVGGGSFANYANLLSAWGLPQTAEELDSWMRST